MSRRPAGLRPRKAGPGSTIQYLPDLVERPISDAAQQGLEPGARAFTFGKCLVIVGRSREGWHLSISCPDRYPTWDEIAHARYSLLPHDIHVAMIMPPREEFVNKHDYCFHLWQIEHDQLRPVYGADGWMVGWERRTWG